MNISVITNNDFMFEGLKYMFCNKSFIVNRVIYSLTTDVFIRNSDLVIVDSVLNTYDAELVGRLHICGVNIIFLLNSVSRIEGTEREAVFIDAKLMGSEYLMMKQVFQKMGITLKQKSLSFTTREAHILYMILNGNSLKEIAHKLLISKRTVQTFVNIILYKLNTTKISGIFHRRNLIIDNLARRNMVFSRKSVPV